MKHYQHLNEEERFYIWNALRTDSSQVDVAQPLNRGPSTICREIKKIKGSQKDQGVRSCLWKKSSGKNQVEKIKGQVLPFAILTIRLTRP